MTIQSNLTRIAKRLARPFTGKSHLRAIPDSLREYMGKGSSGGFPSPPLFAFFFDDRKLFLKKWFPDRTLLIMGMRVDRKMFDQHFRRRLLADSRSEILSWGYRADKWVYDFARENSIPVIYCEDGFIRSTGLGNERQQPLSLCFDRQGLYFDARTPSDLETLLQNYDFDNDVELMRRAEECAATFLKSGLSKYNFAENIDIAALYGEKKAKRILVIGQVEDDASIRYGCDQKINNNDLVRLAHAENPDAQIIYKPHPDTIYGSRKMLSDPNEVADIATVVLDRIPFSQSLETIDHVYTITSLGGFEALLRGIPVTTLGCPFYAGWGLTDARQPNPRRTRTLSVLNVFAAAYILYPRYFHPIENRTIEIEEALEVMMSLKTSREDGQDLTPSALKLT